MLQAPRAGVAVIFRRGPSKWVEVIRWDTQNDRFERGPWFNGRKRQVWLNHRPDEATPHPRHKPLGLRRVEVNPDARGEDGPIYYRRLTRDGWDVRQDSRPQAP